MEKSEVEMKYEELDNHWKRIFELSWESVCHGSKAISALLIDENGIILTEGRNRTGEFNCPNPRLSHAETECIQKLDISKHYLVKTYTLICALEPCPMCMGTAAMSGIRKFIIGCKDDYGGAMRFSNGNKLLLSRNIQVTWMPQFYGDMQRAFQYIKELIYEKRKEKLEEILADFMVYNKAGVMAAKSIFDDGWFTDKKPEDYSVNEIFNELSARIENRQIN